jgi:hypothetical protein
MREEERRTLLPLIGVARDVLSGYDEDEVPQRLRRVAKSSARRLPPPFEQSLMDSIIDDEAFRRDVAEAWSGADREDPIVDAFLDDPDAAARLLSDAADEAEAQREVRETEHLKKRIAQLEAEQATAKTRAGEAQAQAEEQAREARAAAKRSRRGLESSLASARADADAARESLESADAQIAELRQRIDDLEARLRRVSERAAKRTDRVIETVTQPSIPAGAPADIARWLDDAERILRPYREAHGERGRDDEQVGVSLPQGVAPDSPESVEVLREINVGTVILDGYNVASATGTAGFAGSEGRKRTIAIAGSVMRHTGAHTIVVFDAVGVEGRASYVSDIGIDVRFSREVSADDAIVELAQSMGEATVVITNDRELRERSTALGAVALWSDALVAWANT